MLPSAVLFVSMMIAPASQDVAPQRAAGEFVWRTEVDLPPGEHRLVLMRDEPVVLVEFVDFDSGQIVHDARIIAARCTTVLGDLVLDASDVIMPGDTIVDGLIVSQDERRLRMTIDDGKTVMIFPGEKVFVGAHAFHRVLRFDAPSLRQ